MPAEGTTIRASISAITLAAICEGIVVQTTTSVAAL